jgi:Uma2 family endonuclease
MRTVVMGKLPSELDAWIARRRALGHDRFDEVWNGDIHMAPAPHQWHSYLAMEIGRVLYRLADPLGLLVLDAFTVGARDDFRVPDLGLVWSLHDDVWVPTAAMVVEVVSPDDESWLKFDHYAAHGVDEVLIADPQERTLHLFVLVDVRYESTERSSLLDVTVAELHQAIAWPGSQ